MDLHPRSVLKKGANPPEGPLNTLDYLLRFLDAYNFSAESSGGIQKEDKTLINASVLGLIFEKINGYKDGSFFTPGFITEYMARETLRKAVADKFNEAINGNPNPSPSREKDVRQDRMRVSGKAGDKDSQWQYEKAALPEHLIQAARDLRKNQTDAEEVLWQLLRNRRLLGYKFRRQHPMEEGMILDFYCHASKLAIEVDGGYHDAGTQKKRDAERTTLLETKGIRVIRFRNEEVLKETERVLRDIANSLVSGREATLNPNEAVQKL